MKPEKIIRALTPLLVIALLTAMAVPAVSAEEKTSNNIYVINLIQNMKFEISNDIFDNIEGNQGLYTNVYLNSYDETLDNIVNQAMLSTKVKLSPEEQKTLKKLIIDNIISNAEIEKYKEDKGLNYDSATFVNLEDIAEDEGELTKYPVTIRSENGDIHTIDFYQCNVDINGGSGYDIYGNGYTVNGDNDLYKIHFWENSQEFTYQLWYQDEDHPNIALDATYDWYRYLSGGTYEDVALFTIQRNDDTVHLISCYNNGVSYAALTGIHATADRTWTSNIYVSNIWNHDIDVYDVNTNMVKCLMDVPYYLNMPTS